MAITPLEQFMLGLINSDRQKVGASALTFDRELDTAADSHSAWMLKTGVLSHTGENGTSPFDRMKIAQYDYVQAAENVAYISSPVLDQAAATKLHQNLMNSPGHYANLMNPQLKEIGLGLIQGGGKAYVTEVFGSPSKSEAGETDKGGGAAPAPAPTPVPAPKPPVPTAPVVKAEIKGTSGSDVIKGTSGADTIIGGKGSDVITGGKGADTFKFTSIRDGLDRITDFDTKSDHIIVNIKGATVDYHGTRAGIVIEADVGGHDVPLVLLSGVHGTLPEGVFHA